MEETSGLSPQIYHAVDEERTFPTFKTDATTKTDSWSRCTSDPEFSFSFSSLQDFTLADSLKMPFARGPFWLRKQSMSYEEAKKKKLCFTQISNLSAARGWGVQGEKYWRTGDRGTARRTKVHLFIFLCVWYFSIYFLLFVQHIKNIVLKTLALIALCWFYGPKTTLESNFSDCFKVSENWSPICLLFSHYSLKQTLFLKYGEIMLLNQFSTCLSF